MSYGEIARGEVLLSVAGACEFLRDFLTVTFSSDFLPLSQAQMYDVATPLVVVPLLSALHGCVII